MYCPNCHGGLAPIKLQTNGGASLKAKRCESCSGFWFNGDQVQEVSSESARRFDSMASDYSLKTYNLTCPNDQTLMSEINVAGHRVNGRFWRCLECDAVFVPRGHLVGLADWHLAAWNENSKATVGRTQLSEATLLIGLGVYLVYLGWRANTNPLLAVGEPLPNSSPVILPLVLLAVTYLAGIILAILGRKLPIILMGWGVIVVCIFGFVVLAISP